MTQEIEINENNFNEYFFDTRLHKPQKDHVIAFFTAMAEFVDGMEKRNIINLLKTSTEKNEAIAQVMRRCCQTIEKDAYRIPKEMAKDLLDGMSDEEVAKKPYKYTFRSTYYTKKEYVPVDDPHWSIVNIKNLDEFLEKTQDAGGNEIEIKTKIKKNESK